MTTYEQKKQARIERLRARAAKLRRFAEGKDLSVFSERNSGIPMGQPILIGHHSEKRHRRHLERLNRIVEAGYNAGKRAAELESRADNAEQETSIQVDNPDAGQLIQAKIQKLEKWRADMKVLNKLVRQSAAQKDPEKRIEMLALLIGAERINAGDPRALARKLLTPDFCGRIGIPAYQLTNTGAEIRRLKGRVQVVARVQAGFEPFVVHVAGGPGASDIGVELVEGQIQIEFPWKPCQETRAAIKRLAFKWSRYSERWVRKHTESTCSQYFRQELVKVLQEARA